MAEEIPGQGGTKPEGADEKLRMERDTLATELAKVRSELAAVRTGDPENLKAQLAELDAFKKAQAQAEEDRKKKAGEFDSLRDQIVRERNEAVEKERKAREATEKRFRDTLIANAFASASRLFGGADSLTVLTPEIAQAYFSQFVALEDAPESPNGVRLVVKNREGHVVIDPSTGKPAEFQQAISDVINAHPDKDRILRGSGKTGSGSAGGAAASDADDIATLTQKVRAGVTGAAEALQRKLNTSGRIVAGRAFQPR